MLLSLPDFVLVGRCGGGDGRVASAVSGIAARSEQERVFRADRRSGIAARCIDFRIGSRPGGRRVAPDGRAAGGPENHRWERPDSRNWTNNCASFRTAGTAILVDDADARYALYTEACHLRRKIAFSNPLLDFDQIVFIKRHRALYDHMCDQYYGIAATPGGGLYVLEDAFGPEPRVRDILADSVVERGRLAGERL
jgi:hypothetical protein